MTNVIPLHPTPSISVDSLIDKDKPFSAEERERLIADLPWVLEEVLKLVMSEFDYETEFKSNTAIACRILALSVNRLGGTA